MIGDFGTIFNVDLLCRFVINIVTVCVLIWGSYFRRSANNEFLFGAVLFGIGVFIITKILSGVVLKMEFAFGLFALFSLLRYRTESITIKEMTYLFLVICVALISGIAPISYLGLIIINSAVCLIVEIAELVESKIHLFGDKATQTLRYDIIENIKPQRREQLFEDLRNRTGLNIIDVKINEIDLLRDTALLTIIYTKTFDPNLFENSDSAVENKAQVMDIKRNLDLDNNRHSIYRANHVAD